MLVVAIHDVASARLDEVRWLLDRLDAAGLRPRVLAVVPAPDGEELRPDGELAELLRAEQEQGSEIVVHGYTHRSAGRLRGDPVTVARARLFAPQDAELITIDRDEAERRLRRGRELLEAAGLHASGFCAPGWLAPWWLEAAARATGYGYLVGMVRIVDLARDAARIVPAFGYMGADALQERLVGIGGDASIGLNRWLGGRFPDLSAFLHPAGAPASADAARTLERIARMARRLPPTTYAGLLARAPAGSGSAPGG